jgi:hypothetical protein
VGWQGRLDRMETGPGREKRKTKKELVTDWAKLILGLESKKKEYGMEKWLSNFIHGFLFKLKSF